MSLPDRSTGCTAGRSADLADVDEVLAEDPPSLGQDEGRIRITRNGWNELEVGGHASHVDRVAKDRADTVLEHRPAALQRVPQERLAFGEAERDDVAFDADRSAGGDEGLRRRILADQGNDLRPERTELVERLGAGPRGHDRWLGRGRLT